MISNRVYQLFNCIHLRRSAVQIYFHSLHTNCNGKHNLSLIKKIGSTILSSSKCSPHFLNSVCTPVRYFGIVDRLGEVRLLRGLRSDFTKEVEVPKILQSGMCGFMLTKLLNQDTFGAHSALMVGFRQGFNVYSELLCQRDPNDLERDWLLATAQEDTRDIINRLPADCWQIVEELSGPAICMGFQADRSEHPPSVDTAMLYTCQEGFLSLRPNDKKLLWHLVYTRKFGEGVKDSWTIKNVAVFVINL